MLIYEGVFYKRIFPICFRFLLPDRVLGEWINSSSIRISTLRNLVIGMMQSIGLSWYVDLRGYAIFFFPFNGIEIS